MMKRTLQSTCLSLCFAASLVTGAAAQSDLQETADASFASQQWDMAADSYQALVGQDPSVAQNWFNLGRSLHQLQRFEAALEAYGSAIEAGYAREPQARYHMARALMSRGDTDAALQEIEKLGTLGRPTGKVLANTAEFEPLIDDPVFDKVVESLTPCAKPTHRQFDFWLGEWDVTTAANPGPPARNNISLSQDGCIVLEDYTAGNFSGTSLNFYDSVSGKWHQTWMSNAGTAVYMEGGLTEDGAMRLTDRDLPISRITGNINQVTWSLQDDGTVRQHWVQKPRDGGEWTTVFDGIYTKRVEG